MITAVQGIALAQDAIDVKLPDRFDARRAFHNESREKQISIIEIPAAGQTVERWTELITIQTYGKTAYPPPRQAADLFRRRIQMQCPSLQWNEIEVKENDVTVTWSVQGCVGNDDQHEVARFVANASSVFRVAYTVKTKTFSGSDRQWWVDWIRSASIRQK